MIHQNHPEPNEKDSYSVLSVSNAIKMLWCEAADSLTREEFEWLTDLNELAEQETLNLSESLSTIGIALNGVNKACNPSPEQTATLLFSVAHQLDVIAAMTSISSKAADRLINPDRYAKTADTKKPGQTE